MVFEAAGISLPVWLPLLWGMFVGLVFSTVGAAGGILASVGLISVMGIQDPNLVKPMAQALTLTTPLIAVPGYYRQGRVVVSLAGGGDILQHAQLPHDPLLYLLLHVWIPADWRFGLGGRGQPGTRLPDWRNSRAYHA